MCGSNKVTGAKGIHIVSARADELSLILGQVKTDEKSNEITAIPELLELIDIRGNNNHNRCYTLIENAKLNGLVPYDYLRCLFEQPLTLMKTQTGRNSCHGILKLPYGKISASGNFLTVTFHISN